ncbi:ABC transporter substrate-binding protein [Arenibaculum sp.]|jgi:putative spermidine/putrescine transport system substrate-binding protein|uniref:ABC transporter substrate-binding protein n=1 Tax=Arenibaculum sp. TaxID=2865862 RepID=UPI002E11E2D7|nr:extracellular solute-binding protein [Arenibaculum sp.]
MMVKARSVLLAAAALLAGIGGAEAQQKIVLQSWGGTWGDAMKEAWFEPFEKETGIQVELRPQGSMMDALAKLVAQKDRMDVDLWITGMTPTALADEAGILETIPRGKLTNAEHLPDALIGDKYVGVWNTIYGVAYNKETVPFPITKWSDLLDERLAGQVGIPHATGYGGKFILLLGWLGGGDVDNIDPAFEVAAQLKPNIGIISKSDPEAIKFLTSGEVDVAAMMPPGNFVQIREAGPQFEFVAPEPFVPANFNNFALLKGPNTEAAVKFIDFAISKQAQEELARRVLVIPANTQAAIPEELAPFAPPPERLRYPDEVAITKVLPDWAERWDRVIQGR